MLYNDATNPAMVFPHVISIVNSGFCMALNPIKFIYTGPLMKYNTVWHINRQL